MMAHFQLDSSSSASKLLIKSPNQGKEARPDLLHCILCNTELTFVDVENQYKNKKKVKLKCSLCEKNVKNGYVFECSNGDCHGRKAQGGYRICMECYSSNA